MNAKNAWVLSMLLGQGGPQRDERGRFTAGEGTDDEPRPMPRVTAYDGGARPLTPRPLDPEADHAALVVALARRTRSGDPLVA